MKAEIKNKGLLLTITKDEKKILKQVLKENPEFFDSDSIMYDFFEHFIANSEYEWVTPQEIGALTDAPILGIRNINDEIEEAWGFMDYAIISLQRRLLEEGQAFFQKG